tara:strand:- start:785 stop:1312 length:528 start_codon:yes stop_codon:yes gene_type:complete
MKTIVTIIYLMIFPTIVFAELPIGEKPPKVVLKDDLGGRIDGTQWSSEELISEKIIVLFYVDPDESELNNHVSDALKAENFPKDKYGSIGMANMAATWLPNFAINMKLKSKQEKHKNTLYVKDLDKTLVKKWDLSDDNSNVVVFGKNGRVLYSVDGKFTDAQVKEIVKVVWDNLD